MFCKILVIFFVLIHFSQVLAGNSIIAIGDFFAIDSIRTEFRLDSDTMYQRDYKLCPGEVDVNVIDLVNLREKRTRYLNSPEHQIALPKSKNKPLMLEYMRYYVHFSKKFLEVFVPEISLSYKLRYIQDDKGRLTLKQQLSGCLSKDRLFQMEVVQKPGGLLVKENLENYLIEYYFSKKNIKDLPADIKFKQSRNCFHFDDPHKPLPVE